MKKEHAHIWKIFILDMMVIEFGPVAVFFLAYYFAGFGAAALSLAIATGVALVLSKIVNKRVPWFAIFSGTVTMITAVVTYLYDSPTVLIVKDTLYYFLFAGILLVSTYYDKHVFRAFFGHVFALTETGWRILERRWGVFFVLAGTSNELVRMFLSVNEWVLYKQLIVILFAVFGFYQFRVSKLHRTEDADELGLRKLGSSKATQ
jgi:intracellular septation protein